MYPQMFITRVQKRGCNVKHGPFTLNRCCNQTDIMDNIYTVSYTVYSCVLAYFIYSVTHEIFCEKPDFFLIASV